MKTLRTLLAVAACGALISCSQSPTGRTQLQLMSSEQMSQMGAQAFEQMKSEKPLVDNPATRRYVQCVADAVTQTLDDGQGWEVAVFQDDAVNAFALPGKKIGVFTGLLDVAENQHQLAAVIGHEIAHVLADHSNARVSANYATAAGLQLVEAVISGEAGGATREQIMALLGLGAQYGVLMPYGRGQESEADQLGLQYMAEAGFRPEAAVDLWQNMAEAGGPAPPELLSTHPSPQSRIEDLREQIPTVQVRGEAPNCDRYR
ncbi:M48 family metallopeptidase [Proteobacteria bacterium 005FR1]|nr:M48 family metallopeptidase [Proteobacteria bacterium 005FR1]